MKKLKQNPFSSIVREYPVFSGPEDVKYPLISGVEVVKFHSRYFSTGFSVRYCTCTTRAIVEF
jgi:hypothetical protein